MTLIGTASPAVAEVGAGDAAAASGLVTLNTTEEHPFLVERGDVDAWVQAASLKPGAEVRTASGEPAMVVSVQFTGRRATVHNIEVEGLHNYSVGRDGVVVHNAIKCFRAFTRSNLSYNLDLLVPKPSSMYEAHHRIPHRFEHLFLAGFINDPLQNEMWLHRYAHRGSGRSVTNIWEQWARNNPRATRHDVEQFARNLDDEVGLWMIRP